jgi:hypothetical protein
MQLEYRQYPDIALAGIIADNGHKELLSKISEALFF